MMVGLTHDMRNGMNLENPMSYIKNVRVVHNKQLDRSVKEVLVQFKDEPPAWIPYETLLAMPS